MRVSVSAFHTPSRGCGTDPSTCISFMHRLLTTSIRSIFPILFGAQGAALDVLKYLESELAINVAQPSRRDGSTALHLAAECKGGVAPAACAQTCEWLAQRIDVNVARHRDQMTPLHVAARSGKDKVTRVMFHSPLSDFHVRSLVSSVSLDQQYFLCARSWTATHMFVHIHVNTHTIQTYIYILSHSRSHACIVTHTHTHTHTHFPVVRATATTN